MQMNWKKLDSTDVRLLYAQLEVIRLELRRGQCPKTVESLVGPVIVTYLSLV